MPLAVAHTVVWMAIAYFVIGAGFALWFVARGAGRLDRVAVEGSRGFRILISPGAALLWPLLAVRLRRSP